MKMKRLLAIVLSLSLLVSLAPISSIVRALDTDPTVTEKLAVEELNDVNAGLAQISTENENLAVDQSLVDENGMVSVFIVMEGESVIEENAAAVLDEDTMAKVEELEEYQAEIVAEIEETVLAGEKLDVSYNHTWLFNGVSASVPYSAMEDIAAIDGVKEVIVQPVYELFEETNSKDASLYTISDGIMVGRESTWAEGYTGQGMKIAIIDTGLDIDHQNFQALSADKLTEDSATAESVAAHLEGLNASVRYGGLSIDDVYYSTKVVYGFNYADDSLDITHDNDAQGDHGSHVAGIAAANKVDGSDVVGVAPDAQLYVMKVFGYLRGGYAEDIVAALEDALMLGVDVVNMSLGTNAGFTTSGSEFIDAIYARVAETNTVLSVSAGNNYTAGYGNSWGTNANTTSNPDNSVIGEPAVYQNVMSVASVENWKIQRNYVQVSDGYRMGYVETSTSYGLPSVLDLEGEYGLVVVSGYGETSDLEGLDVEGKVVLVQRGVISFAEKVQNADAAGAAACFVYNNTSGEFGMDLTDCTAGIPAISITMADGDYLIAALESDPQLKLSFPKETTALDSEQAYQMSDFSSWGVAPDLSLEPDITAPGGNIFSTINDGEYGLMSGTSMAAPNISGISALVMQYVKENFDSDYQLSYRTLVQNLMMSTSTPLVYGDGLYFSPRSQGSGLANAYNAVKAQAYLSVDGCDSPKAELGQDAEKNGVYSFTFSVNNFSAKNAYYDLSTVVQTEDYMEVDGVYFMSSTPLALSAGTAESTENLVLTHDVDGDEKAGSHDAYLIYQAAAGNAADDSWTGESFRYDTDGNDAVSAEDVQAYLDALVGNESEADLEDTVLQVAAGESAQVSVTITLTEEDKAYFDTYYENGGYVEGFTFLTAKNENGVDLSLPYLAFFGDWDDAPILDDGNYWDMLNGTEDEVVGNQYVHVLWTNFYGEASYYYPGANVYVEEVFDPSHISVSPNGDGYFDTIDDIYTSLLRNAATMTYRYTNMETGEVYYEQSVGYVNKSIYSSSYEQIVPAVYSWFDGEIPVYDWKDADGNDLVNGTKLLLEVEATGAYDGATADTWSVPVIVDLEAPTLLEAKKIENTETGELFLELSFRDNLAVSVAAVMSSDGYIIYGMDGVEDVEPDENGYQNHTMTFDITGASGKLMIVLGDYAMNESCYGLNLGGEGAPYGELVAYQYNFVDETYGWISFDPVGVVSEVEPEQTEVTEDTEETETTEAAEAVAAIQQVQITMDEMNFVCAEYVGGYVFAQTETGALYGFRYTDLLVDSFEIEETFITQLDITYFDMAYSYTEGKLYGLYAFDDGYGYTTEIHEINVNGYYYNEESEEYVEPFQEDWAFGRGGLYGLSMTIDDKGTIYILGLNEDDKTELWNSYTRTDFDGLFFQKTMDIDVSMDYAQSITWNHNTGKLYWAQFYPTSIFTYDCALYQIYPDARRKTYKFIGTLNGETCGLFAPLSDETVASNEIYRNVPEMDPTTVGTPVLREDVVNMNIGAQMTLLYDMDPWYTDHKDVIWSTSDESVVAVDQNGRIAAVSEGTAVITLTSAEDQTLSDSCTVNVTALSLSIEGVISAQSSGIGNSAGTSLYRFTMDEGLASFGTTSAITAPEEFSGYGLEMATSVYARDSIWTCEYGNTGMIYQIDPETGSVMDVLMPMDGDMLFGLTYNEDLDTFTGIMNMYLYVDLELTHEEESKVLESYDENLKEFTYHKINMLDYLIAAGGNFVTGEDGQGASSEVVMCGITTLPGGYTYTDTGMDFLGNVTMDEVNYTATQTLVILDNVGRLWYVDEICGLTKNSTGWSVEYTSDADPDTCIMSYTGYEREGLIEIECEDGTYNLFCIRAIEETPLTTMFREGSMPRITYHFSDIEFGGYTEDGAPIYALSLYDYWNNGTTNELYLYIPEVSVYDETLGADVLVAKEKFYSLGNTGEYNIIASIHNFEVTGGLGD